MSPQHNCELCNGSAVYVCPICHEEIEMHSHENDFICKTHSFVNPIRLADGAVISGDGWLHGPTILNRRLDDRHR